MKITISVPVDKRAVAERMYYAYQDLEFTNVEFRFHKDGKVKAVEVELEFEAPLWRAELVVDNILDVVRALSNPELHEN